MRANHGQSSIPSVGRLPKTAGDYLGALGRNWWFILLMTAAVGGAGTWFTLNQEPVYMAVARVLIEPPREIVPELAGNRQGPAAVNFFNTRMQMISSREISSRVLNSQELRSWKELTGIEDPLGTLVGWIDVKPVQNSNLVDVMLEGTDPAVVEKLTNLVVGEFLRYEDQSLKEFETLSRSEIDSELLALNLSKDNAAKQLAEFDKSHESDFNSEGQTVAAARLVELEKAMTQAELRADETERAVERFEALIKADVPYYSPSTLERSEEIRNQIFRIDEELSAQKEHLKAEYYEADPAIRRLRMRRDEMVSSMESLGKDDADYELSRLKQEHQFSIMDLDNLRKQIDEQRSLVHAEQDKQQQRDRLKSELDRLQGLADRMAINKLEIEMHQGLIAPRIQVIDKAEVPMMPVRPIKEIQIPLCFAGGLFVGCLLILGLETIGQRVRRAEQAVARLDMPMLGVIPRLRRGERYSWGGKLKLASEQPGTRVCETFRSLRMGLLGAEGNEPLRSLVVSSPTSGEGKSVVAANLAATCARAGETVLVVDMDLRHPMLGKKLGLSPKAPGLVESVAGTAVWQEVVQETGVPNLYVLPSGNSHSVPLDILGTAEMHDLLSQLAEEFDRVILDGPPILGIADARVVGRFCDGMMLVVQANLHQAKALDRVRQLCEHEDLHAVGMVFNGIRYKHDDLRTFRPARVPQRRREEPETPRVVDVAAEEPATELTETQVA